MYQELSTFIIFPEPTNIYNSVSFKCHSFKLNSVLIAEEMVSPEQHYSEFNWVIFENGMMIQG